MQAEQTYRQVKPVRSSENPAHFNRQHGIKVGKTGLCTVTAVRTSNHETEKEIYLANCELESRSLSVFLKNVIPVECEIRSLAAMEDQILKV